MFLQKLDIPLEVKLKSVLLILSTINCIIKININRFFYVPYLNLEQYFAVSKVVYKH
jgi:hypothetical protein